MIPKQRRVEDQEKEEQNRWDTINKREKKDKQQREEKDEIKERRKGQNCKEKKIVERRGR